MSARVNNGIPVGGVHVLVRRTERDRSAYEVVRDLAASLLVLDDVESTDWMVTVHHDASGQVVASRRFATKHRAERARTELIDAAEASDDVASFDWVANLART